MQTRAAYHLDSPLKRCAWICFAGHYETHGASLDPTVGIEEFVRRQVGRRCSKVKCGQPVVGIALFASESGIPDLVIISQATLRAVTEARSGSGRVNGALVETYAQVLRQSPFEKPPGRR